MVLKITVKTLDSNNYEFEANDDWTVKKFKENIQQTVEVPAEEQRLIFCGRVLLDDKKLTEYDCNEKVMHLVRRPPPPLNNPDQPTTSRTDPNNNTSTSGNDEGNSRLLDEGQIFINAMTVGPESVNYILRQILTLQQAAYVRGFVDGPSLGASSVEPLTMTSLDRHLHNAARLLRMTVNAINECMARIAVLPPAAPRSASTNPSLESSRPSMMASASSHTDLQRDTVMLSSEDQRQRTQHQLEVTVDDMGVNNGSGSSPHRAQARNMPRQSLTTDDLPQPTRPVHRFVPTTVRSHTENQRAPLTLRQRNESELDRYLTLINHASDLQNQFQGLARRYRQLIDMSRRGGLIVPQYPSAQNTAGTRSSEHQASTSAESNQQTPPTLVNEARILASYIPRIMHHISHLQHALSDFSIDFERGALFLNISNSERTGRYRQMARQSTPPQFTPRTRSNSRPSDSQNGRLSTRPQEVSATVNIRPERPSDISGTVPTLEGSLTITATTVETAPLVSTSAGGLRPQANATIVVTSEPLQSGFQFPISLGPINLGPNPQGVPAGSATRSTDEPSRQPTGQQGESPQHNTTSNSTQTNRPIRVVSGRLPPFDFFLPCLSPWAVNTYRSANGGPQTPNRVHVRTTRQQAPARSQGANLVGVQVEPPRASTTENINRQTRTTPPIIGDLVGQLFMGGPLQSRTSTSSSQPTATLGSNPDSFINMIPEIALNAASQILGGVLGIPVTNQQSNHQSTVRQQQTSSTSTGGVMMDIDIDDSSSSQSESRYQDARESHSPAGATATRNESISRSMNVPSQPATHSRDVPRSSGSSQTCDRRRLQSIMQNHPDWIPIIEADINLMESQTTINSGQPAFSDAYLSSIPRKRRRLLTTSSDRVLILQPSPSQAISNLLRRAITSSSASDIESLDQVLLSISSDADLQSAYEDYIKTAVEARLMSDFDYCPQKFENSSKYFK